MTNQQINEVIGTALSKVYRNGWHHPDGCDSLPDFSGDANEVWEFEQVLPVDGSRSRQQYIKNLLRVCDVADWSLNATWAIRHATPRQCAEAFLRTIGKWVDDEHSK